MNTYIPSGICPKKIQFSVEDNLVKHVEFTGGCPGNLQALSKLVQDMPVDKVIETFKGNLCRNGTSCMDQFAIALETYKYDTKSHI